MKRSARSLVAVAAIACSHFFPTCLADATLAPQSPPPSDATCPTQSINYVTHTLPQQCLRTSWSSSAGQHNASSIHDATQAPTHTSIVETIVVSLSPNASAAAASPASDHTSRPADGASAAIPGATSDAVASLPSASSQPTEEDDPDSFLDAAKFLSFEDWKKQKIGEAGASTEALARSRGDARLRPGEGFDTLGEESEINLDFGGFGSAMRPLPSASYDSKSIHGSHSIQDATPSPGAPRVRSKDAGRTCKERFNYASFDCAASVLKTNAKCKSPTSVLVENKDSYMLNECSSDNKFLIVELCEYVEIDTVVLANFEFFSSMFRTFRVSVSDRYPVKLDKWQVLGTYEARNSREIQAFLVENPVLWAKFLRIEFLTHYGSEFYCPLSLLRVHGTNMMEDFRRQEELAQGVLDAPEDIEVIDSAVISVDPEIDQNSVERDFPRPKDLDEISGAPEDSTPAPAASIACPAETFVWSLFSNAPVCPASDQHIHPGDIPLAPSKFAFTQDFSTTPSITNSPTSPMQMAKNPSSPLAATSEPPLSNKEATSTMRPLPIETLPSTSIISTSSLKPSPASSASSPGDSGSRTIQTTSQETEAPLSPVQSSIQSSMLPQSPASSIAAVASYSTSSQSSSQASSPSGSVLPPAPQSPSPHPPTQESIFKSITKRLALLEANATLSLQYIESQSSLLRSAFAATNSQQLNKTANFLAQLNATVLNELARAKEDYDQLWQSTVLELHGQREDSRKEREILGERVRLLAEEVVGTKRLMAAQATLLLVVLGLVLFTRNASVASGNSSNGASVDLRFLSAVQGLVRHGRSRSGAQDADARGRSGPRRRWHWENVSPWHSPTQTRPSTSASADDDGLGIRHHVSPAPSSGPSLPRDKPLPPAPRDVSRNPDDEPDSDSMLPERRDTLTQRDFQPALRIYDPGPREELFDTSPLSAGTSSSDDDDEQEMRGRRPGALRDVRSAPTTPGVSGTPPDGILESALETQRAEANRPNGESKRPMDQ